jgi:hypothetical protein
MKTNKILTGIIGLAVVGWAAGAWAQNIATVEAGPSDVAATLGTDPVVTAILSQPGVFGGHTYTGWSFLANDGSGSVDVFATAATLTTLGYTPTLGDSISLGGTYFPFHQIPEFESSTPAALAITLVSQGNPIPAPVVATIPQLDQTTLPFSLAGELIQLNNVTIGNNLGANGTVFPTFAQDTVPNESYTVTDGSANSMVLFDWVSSYSTAAALGGTAVPTGPVDLIGFVSVNGTGTSATAEFTPTEILPTPEPATLTLLTVGGGLLAFAFRKRR